MQEHGTKTPLVFLHADIEASWLLLPSSGGGGGGGGGNISFWEVHLKHTSIGLQGSEV